MFPKAHKILFVIICNGWFTRNIIQTGLSDYIDYGQNAWGSDYSNIKHPFQIKKNSKRVHAKGSSQFLNNRNPDSLQKEFPNPKPKETLGEFTKRAGERLMVNPTEQKMDTSIQKKEASPPNPVAKVRQLNKVKSRMLFVV